MKRWLLKPPLGSRLKAPFNLPRHCPCIKITMLPQTLNHEHDIPNRPWGQAMLTLAEWIPTLNCLSPEQFLGQFLKCTKPYPALPRRPPDNQVGRCQSGRLVLQYYREDHLLQGQPRRGKRDKIQSSPATPDRVPVLTATGDRATSPCSGTGTSVVSAHWGDDFRLR